MGYRRQKAFENTLFPATVAKPESEMLQLRKALNEARPVRDILKKRPVDSICQCNTPFNYLFRCFELQCLSRSASLAEQQPDSVHVEYWARHVFL